MIRTLGADIKDSTTVEQMEKIRKLYTMVRELNIVYKNNVEHWTLPFQLGEVPDSTGELSISTAASILENQFPTPDSMKIEVINETTHSEYRKTFMYPEVLCIVGWSIDRRTSCRI